MANLIHIGRIGSTYFYLRKIDSQFTWFKEENPTEVNATTAEEAIRLAFQSWAHFRLLGCGYRFSLPERDEHGLPAYFDQMVKSINTLNGIYFEESLGYNCIVHQIPSETRQLYEKLKSLNKL